MSDILKVKLQNYSTKWITINKDKNYEVEGDPEYITMKIKAPEP